MNSVMILKPRVSEKAYGLSQKASTYVFDVPVTSNKMQIKSAVEETFSVNVVSVNIVIIKGKAKKSSTKRGQKMGQRADYKKAYVLLKSGDSIPIFSIPSDTTSNKVAKNV